MWLLAVLLDKVASSPSKEQGLQKTWNLKQWQD